MSDEQLQEEIARRQKEKKTKAEAAKRQYENDKDNAINYALSKVRTLHNQMKEFKATCVQEFRELRDRAFELQNQEPKEQKRFAVVSKCGMFKVVVDNQEIKAFDEHAEVAINTIKDVLRDKFEQRNKTMYKIINDILIKNNEGDYDERLVAKLRKHESDIDDPRFSKALDELSKSYYTTGSATYVRFYEKNDAGKFKDITLQFSAL